MSSPVTALLDGVMRRSEAAFSELVAEMDTDLLRLAFLITADSDAARDAVQTTWETLWRRPPNLRQPERLRSWLLSVAANEARQVVRRRRVGASLERRATGGGELLDPEQAVANMDLGRALLTLSVDDRELLTLRYVLELSSSEVAAHLGISPEGVRSRARRALSKLREELRDER